MTLYDSGTVFIILHSVVVSNLCDVRVRIYNSLIRQWLGASASLNSFFGAKHRKPGCVHVSGACFVI